MVFIFHDSAGQSSMRRTNLREHAALPPTHTAQTSPLTARTHIGKMPAFRRKNRSSANKRDAARFGLMVVNEAFDRGDHVDFCDGSTKGTGNFGATGIGIAIFYRNGGVKRINLPLGKRGNNNYLAEQVAIMEAASHAIHDPQLKNAPCTIIEDCHQPSIKAIRKGVGIAAQTHHHTHCLGTQPCRNNRKHDGG